MSEQRKQKPGGRRIEEFTVAMPLDKCVRRLEARHEPGKFWAWDWQYRTWVKVRRIEGLTYRFTMRRVERSMFELPWSYGSVRGYLRALDGENTVVIAEERISSAFLLLLSLFFGMSFSFAFTPLTGLTVFDPRTAILFVLMVVALTVGFLALMWFWVQHQIRMLFGELHEALTHFNLVG